MSQLTGYRTYIAAGLMLLSTVLARWGFEFDVTVVLDALMVLGPALMVVMRSVTRTPPAAKALIR